MSNGELPKDADGLQLNFCKTLACDNFGLSDAKYYILQRANPKRPAMVCRECGAFPPLLNNRDVLNELYRLRHLHSEGLPACRNLDCESFGLSVHTHKHLYHAFGYSGDRQRYRCKACQSTFVDKWSGANKRLQFQENLMGLLFTGYSVREICRKLNINPKTFYDHVNNIASRCRRKLATIDARWVNHANHYELASAYTTLQPNSHNGVYWIVSGEAHSGYILCQHVNYSANEEPVSALYHDPYDQVSRFVSTEYTAEASEPVPEPAADLRQRIDQKYQTILARGNVEDPLGNLSLFQYPSKGALVRPPYTSYAHYIHVLEMCCPKKRVSIYMPHDTLLRSAALSVCASRIQENSIDLMYVEEDENWDMTLPFGKIDIAYMSWWRDRWSISSQGENQKGICQLAGNKIEPEKWFNLATTRNIQLYQHRFHLLFESFINEPRRKLRPAGILPLIDIFRAWHNLCYQDKQGLTAAQRLKVTDTPLTIKELLS